MKEQAFAKADMDGDGAISKVEFGEQLSAKGVSSDRIDNMFNHIDSSGDGSISIDESNAAMDEMKSKMEDMMSMMKSLGSGSVDGGQSMSLLDSLEESDSESDEDPYADLRSYVDELKRSGAGSAGNFFSTLV